MALYNGHVNEAKKSNKASNEISCKQYTYINYIVDK